MVKGVTRPADERMSTQAKVVFGIVILLSLIGMAFAYLAKDTSSATKESLGRQDCARLFTAPITNATTQGNKADNEVRRAQFLGQYYGLATDDEAHFDASIDLGFKGLEDQYTAQFRLHWFNDQYQELVRAQQHDHEKFKMMCKQGPDPAPPPPPYIAPPR